MKSKIIDARKPKILRDRLKSKILLLTENQNESDSVIDKLLRCNMELENENKKLKLKLGI